MLAAPDATAAATMQGKSTESPQNAGNSTQDDPKLSNLGALIVRAGFGGILYYNYYKEPPTPYMSNY